MSDQPTLISPASVMLFKNGLTSFGGVISALGTFLIVLGYAEYGAVLLGTGASLSGFFGKDGNKSSKSTGLES